MGEVDSTLLLPDPLMGGWHAHVRGDAPPDDESDDPADDFDPSGSLIGLESSSSLPTADVSLSDVELPKDIIAQGFGDPEYETLARNPRYVA